MTTRVRTHRVDRLWAGASDGNIGGILHGKLPNKSNSRKLVYIGKAGRKRPAFIKSPAARLYEEQFAAAVAFSEDFLRVAILPVHGPLRLTAWIIQADLRRDLDAELLPDLLQKNRIIGNDRQIWEKHYIRRLNPENPAVIFVVERILIPASTKEAYDDRGPRELSSLLEGDPLGPERER